MKTNLPFQAVILGLKRSSSELSSHQRKVFKIDNHLGIVIAGLTADARQLSGYMRSECLSHKFVYNAPMQVSRLAEQIAAKSQVTTQRYGRRPYGVGLIMAGYDKTGAHIFQTDPTGAYFDYKAISIGSRSQSAKTYLEKTFESYPGLGLADLIKHGVAALKETVQTGTDLSTKNVTIAYVGKDTPFTVLENDAVAPYITEADGGAAPTPMQS